MSLSRFRRVPDDDFMMDNEFIQEDGSYIFPNITEANSAYASGDGIEYYCTAANNFGTIRSRTVRAFYAGERPGNWVGGHLRVLECPHHCQSPFNSAFDWQSGPCVLVSSAGFAYV